MKQPPEPPYSSTRSEFPFDGFFKVRRDWIRVQGEDHPYDILILKGDAVSVIVETTDGNLLLQWEWRHPIQNYLLSTVGGLIDKGESPLEAAKRELLEETGYEAASFRLLGTHYPFPGMTGQKLYVVLASAARHVHESSPEPLERISLEKFPYSTLKEKIHGMEVDGVLLSSLYYYGLRNPLTS